MLFIIVRYFVLEALPQYFLLLPPSFWVNVEFRNGGLSGTGSRLAMEVWSWAGAGAVC